MSFDEKKYKYLVKHMDGNVFYGCKGYKIYKSENKGESWQLDGVLDDKKYAKIANLSRLLSRLLRIEIKNIYTLKNESRVVIAKKGIFLAKKDEKQYRKVFNITRGNRPLNICIDANDTLYFGEYILNGGFEGKEREEVHIYKSTDGGESWSVCHTFSKNSVRHVHGIFYDKFTNRVWFATGDQDEECIIGYTEDAFKTTTVFKEGKQKYRAVQLFFFKDTIVYGTDTELEQNFIYSIERESGEETQIQAVQGSVIEGGQTDNFAYFSTTVEPSEVNKDPYSHVWMTENGREWREIYKAKKDNLSPKYFQYGKISFPHNAYNDNSLTFNGHALQNIDNKSVKLKL